jgi:hypothetical protein
MKTIGSISACQAIAQVLMAGAIEFDDSTINCAVRFLADANILLVSPQ